MSYRVKEVFHTLQGEGAQSGRPAVFCRFAGCNLWSGREVDRGEAICRFCDTDFRGTDGEGGGRYADAGALADKIHAVWTARASTTVAPYVVCTGGEPLLQLDRALIDALHARGCEIAVETNGTCPVPAGIDWLCVSPKAGAALVVTEGNELKLVYPQSGMDADGSGQFEQLRQFERLDFRHFFLQPLDGPDRIDNTLLAINACKARPRWRLSVQLHKVLGIP